MKTKIDEHGFLILRGFLEKETVFYLTQELSKLNLSGCVRQKNETVYGVRNLLNLLPEIKKFSQSHKVRNLAKIFTGENTKVVRAIYFDKTPEANWKVPWHQDLTIAVDEKRETEGFSAWTRKDGIQHVQPPIEILEKMVALRFNLDDADDSNGALKVIPKSHKHCRLNAEEIKNLREANETAVCNVKKGDCLIMRPLLVHSSSAGSKPRNRRVIHLEFSADNLPNNLQWYGS